MSRTRDHLAAHIEPNTSNYFVRMNGEVERPNPPAAIVRDYV